MAADETVDAQDQDLGGLLLAGLDGRTKANLGEKVEFLGQLRAVRPDAVDGLTFKNFQCAGAAGDHERIRGEHFARLACPLRETRAPHHHLACARVRERAGPWRCHRAHQVVNLRCGEVPIDLSVVRTAATHDGGL